MGFGCLSHSIGFICCLLFFSAPSKRGRAGYCGPSLAHQLRLLFNVIHCLALYAGEKGLMKTPCLCTICCFPLQLLTSSLSKAGKTENYKTARHHFFSSFRSYTSSQFPIPEIPKPITPLPSFSVLESKDLHLASLPTIPFFHSRSFPVTCLICPLAYLLLDLNPAARTSTSSSCAPQAHP
ncbi:uncharacterized protein B0T23DRAFT_102766 [Neurospora hispaniola]|uniref:Secreted protein n=1 Tax=Neurospora hispaniola TaxID=588809 RepID=A0AAJ0I9G0_9PEZI|nr:hypothetical protein B0T23DRAFT_102766 [Neurospora hispaniola]